jgi:hypothetical protein
MRNQFKDSKQEQLTQQLTKNYRSCAEAIIKAVGHY